MFGIKSEDVVEFTGSKYITYGVQEVKINDIIIKPASTGTPMVSFIVESKPVTDRGFVPDDSATVGGRVGTVKFGALKTDDQIKSFCKAIILIARYIGQEYEAQLNGFEAPTIEEYIKKAKEVICGHYVFLKICGEEYLREGKPNGVFLKLARFGFVSNDANRLSFEKTNIYDFKPLQVVPDAEKVEEETTEKVPF